MDRMGTNSLGNRYRPLSVYSMTELNNNNNNNGGVPNATYQATTGTSTVYTSGGLNEHQPQVHQQQLHHSLQHQLNNPPLLCATLPSTSTRLDYACNNNNSNNNNNNNNNNTGVMMYNNHSNCPPTCNSNGRPPTLGLANGGGTLSEPDSVDMLTSASKNNFVNFRVLPSGGDTVSSRSGNGGALASTTEDCECLRALDCDILFALLFTILIASLLILIMVFWIRGILAQKEFDVDAP